MQYSRGFSQIKHTWVGANAAHHTLSHMTSRKTVLAKIQGWYAERFAGLIDQFKAVPEGGQTLFDNTILVYSNELSLGLDAWLLARGDLDLVGDRRGRSRCG